MLPLLVTLLGACLDHVAGPVVPPPPPQTVPGPATGSWIGNGPNFILSISLADTVIVATGVGTIGGTGTLLGPGIRGDSASFDILGLDSSGVLHLLLVSPSHLTAFFNGLALPGDTAIGGTLDGSGFSHLPLSLSHHPEVTRLQVGPQDDSLLTGNTVQLVDSGFDLLGRPLGPQPATWTTSQPTFATVSATGLVTAVGAGQSDITATAHGLAAHVTVRTLQRANSVVLVPQSMTLVPADTWSFAATALDSLGGDVTSGRLSWSSTNPAVAQVSASGAVTAEDTGVTTITAKSILDNVSKSGQVVVRHLRVASLAAGFLHTCAIDADSTVACWGYDSFGALPGAGTTSVPGPFFIGTPLKFKAIGAGLSHTCALAVDSTAYCWGSNFWGQMGTSDTGSALPEPVTGGLKFTTLAVGYSNTCGLVPGGSAYCWGYNYDGEVGSGLASPSVNVPTAVSGGLSFASLAAGDGVTCGLTAGGAAYCWGYNGGGALGDGTVLTRATPTAVAGGLSFMAITTSGDHSCGITTAGAAYCWGSDVAGALGDSGAATQLVPVPVHSGGVTFRAISAGYNHTCAVATSGAIYCWGSNELGQVGPNGGPASPVPV
ncbi:MAG TPA: Ig-like domain-containing protein, partial [Gemmatimonadales bacterium]